MKVYFLMILFFPLTAFTQPGKDMRVISSSIYFPSPSSPWAPPLFDIQVKAGQLVTIKTEGKINFGCDNCWVTADGADCDFAGRLEPSLVCEGLIGKIGNGKAFKVGTFFSQVATTSGRLLLSINDGGNFMDNEGRWTSTVEISESDPCAGKTECDNIPALDRPAPGDVIIFWSGDEVFHSGIVKTVVPNSCEVETFESRIKDLNSVVTKSPDAKDIAERFGTTWTIYRTARNSNIDLANKNHINLVPANYPIMTTKYPRISLNTYWMGQTDEKDNLPYLLLYKSGANCHGFTFTGGYINIVGYMKNGDMHYDPNFPSVDQSKAAKYILKGNHYRQLHSTGKNNACDHYKSIYDTKSSLFDLK